MASQQGKGLDRLDRSKILPRPETIRPTGPGYINDFTIYERELAAQRRDHRSSRYNHNRPWELQSSLEKDHSSQCEVQKLQNDEKTDVIHILNDYGITNTKINKLWEIKNAFDYASKEFTKILGEDHPYTTTYSEAVGIINRVISSYNDTLITKNIDTENHPKDLWKDLNTRKDNSAIQAAQYILKHDINAREALKLPSTDNLSHPSCQNTHFKLINTSEMMESPQSWTMSDLKTITEALVEWEIDAITSIDTINCQATSDDIRKLYQNKPSLNAQSRYYPTYLTNLDTAIKEKLDALPPSTKFLTLLENYYERSGTYLKSKEIRDYLLGSLSEAEAKKKLHNSLKATLSHRLS